MQAPKLPFILASASVLASGIALHAGLNRALGLTLALSLAALASAWLLLNRPRLVLVPLILSRFRRR